MSCDESLRTISALVYEGGILLQGAKAFHGERRVVYEHISATTFKLYEPKPLRIISANGHTFPPT